MQAESKKIDWKKAGSVVLQILAVAVFVGCFFLFLHDDLMETANHSYLLLESLFSGRFFHFYTDVAAHENTLYYLNDAHYNILVYLIFAVWQLPLFLINRIFGLAVNEGLLWMWSKAVPCLFYLLCVGEIRAFTSKVASERDGRCAALFFLLCPFGFFSAFVMGQYVSLCLFGLLRAMRALTEHRVRRFCLLTGLATAVNPFAMIAAVPMLLLSEKRLRRIWVDLGLMLLPTVCTGLIFWGKTTNSSFLMDNFTRMFAGFHLGAAEFALFPCCYALLCSVCLLVKEDREGGERTWLYRIGYAGMFAYVTLLVGMYWHPQWMILTAPFLAILAALQTGDRRIWFFLCGAMSAGFFFLSWLRFPHQMAHNLGYYGVLYLFGRSHIMAPALSFPDWFGSFSLAPTVAIFPFVAAVLCFLVLWFPKRGGSLADTLCDPCGCSETIWMELLFVGAILCWAGASYLPYLVQL